MKYVFALATISAVAFGSGGAMAAAHHRGDDAMARQQQGWASSEPATRGDRAAQPRGAFGARTVNGYMPEIRSNDSPVSTADQNYGNPDRW
jgi:hypothetical protein